MSTVLITADDFDTYCAQRDELELANSLLCALCAGLEGDNVPMPPELLDWWIGYKKKLEADEPRIQLIN